MERQLGGLGERAYQEQEAGGHDRAVVRGEVVARLLEDRRKSSEPTLSNIRNAAITRPDVADHVDHERLDAGGHGGGAPYQYEISRYEAAPTNAHPMIRITKFAARTSSIEKTK